MDLSICRVFVFPSCRKQILFINIPHTFFTTVFSFFIIYLCSELFQQHLRTLDITQLTDQIKIFCANMLEYKLFSPSFRVLFSGLCSYEKFCLHYRMQCHITLIKLGEIKKQCICVSMEVCVFG